MNRSILPSGHLVLELKRKKSQRIKMYQNIREPNTLTENEYIKYGEGTQHLPISGFHIVTRTLKTCHYV